MRKPLDFVSGDMFPVIPQAADLASPTVDLKVKIANAMSRAMKSCSHDRYEIAARMSRFLGRDVTKNMLDAYSSASKDTHIPNFAFCIVFDQATEQNELLNLYASLSGCSVLVGVDTVRAELLKIEEEEQVLRTRKRQYKTFLRGRR